MIVAKLKTAGELAVIRSQMDARGQKLVLTNGCFDLLHAGHVRYLQAARALGEALVVALNGDDSIRILKGPKRPINEERDRAEVLAGLACVDFVTIFQDPRVTEVIAKVKPHFYARAATTAWSHSIPTNGKHSKPQEHKSRSCRWCPESRRAGCSIEWVVGRSRGRKAGRRRRKAGRKRVVPSMRGGPAGSATVNIQRSTLNVQSSPAVFAESALRSADSVERWKLSCKHLPPQGARASTPLQ